MGGSAGRLSGVVLAVALVSGTAGGTPPAKRHATAKVGAARSFAPRAAPRHAARPHESIAVFPPEPEALPAVRYAAMDRASCTAELTKRAVRFTEVTDSTPGVLAPVRLDGPLDGVTYRTELPDARREKSPWEVFDCRLVLALYDFGSILRAHGIDEVVMFSAWRPPAKSWPMDRIASRHPGALALDARKFHKSDGSWMVVETDFHGRIGETTCGPDAQTPAPATDAARELRSIVCEAADAHIFNSVLTPNYNAPHYNHFHLEVTAGVKWFLVR